LEQGNNNSIKKSDRRKEKYEEEDFMIQWKKSHHLWFKISI